MNRRDFIKLGATGWVLAQTPISTLANSNQPKIIWVILRGAMDSLHALVPTNDPHLMTHRASLITPIEKNLLSLNNQFSLHPAFTHLHQWYQQKQLLPVVAVASPYRKRSHFEGQDMLESGLNSIDHNNGWLARAFNEHQKRQASEAISITQSIPVSLRGENTIRTFYPSRLKEADTDIYQKIEQLYQDDPLLSSRLQEAIEARNMVSMEKNKKRQAKFSQLTKMCGELMAQRPDACCAMLEMGGWDTHNAQVNRLNRQFKLLDNGLQTLKVNLGKEWHNTVVLIATEFGRTVAVNGTKGTDHGTGSALFIAGGLVNGGQVMGKWPGLAPEQLYQGRDLRPTSDIRSWIVTLLKQHWKLTDQQIAYIFPNVEGVQERLIL